MEMMPNLTILVQMINFLGAYVIITRFLLRPGYRVVKSDDNKVRQIKSQIIARQELIAHKQEYKRSRWNLFQDYFLKHKPHMIQQVTIAHPRKKGVIVQPRFSKDELGSLSQNITDAIKDKVGDV